MASVLDKYGIKEVADITFYQADKNGKPAYPVLYIDTAKTSTIEQTADETTAKGGKGNPSLISWDYNKDITVTLEDALFSAKSLAIMFGNGKTYEFGKNAAGQVKYIMKTDVFLATADGTIGDVCDGKCGWNKTYEGPDGKLYNKINPKFFDENGKSVASVEKNAKYFCSYDLEVFGSAIRIAADTFPGTYYVTGDTWARSQANGEDEFFQFIIPKAKIKSENTITMEADGDPSVFKLDLHVLRPDNGDMMKLIKYELYNGSEPTGDSFDLYHNHELNVPQEGEGVPTQVPSTTLTDELKADAARFHGANEDGTKMVNNTPKTTPTTNN